MVTNALVGILGVLFGAFGVTAMSMLGLRLATRK